MMVTGVNVSGSANAFGFYANGGCRF